MIDAVVQLISPDIVIAVMEEREDQRQRNETQQAPEASEQGAGHGSKYGHDGSLYGEHQVFVRHSSHWILPPEMEVVGLTTALKGGPCTE